ncbi:MAG: hypothetical protein WAW86_02295 [Gammaproteobacteria bacterium]
MTQTFTAATLKVVLPAIEEAENIRNKLLDYFKQDIFAMVKIHKKLLSLRNLNIKRRP